VGGFVVLFVYLPKNMENNESIKFKCIFAVLCARNIYKYILFI